METYIISFLLFVIVVGFIYYNSKIKGDSTSNKDLMQFSKDLRSEIQDIRKEIDANSKESRTEIESKLKATNDQISDFLKTSKSDTSKQHEVSTKMMKEVAANLVKVKNTNEQVLSFSNQLKNLEKTFSNVKARGSFGEVQLQNMLSDYLPVGTFEMQYNFKNGDKVDAIIRMDQDIIPIDAKFPLENYDRLIECTTTEEEKKYEKAFKEDVKKRIDETAKYVRPTEGTIEFAYMYVPAEGLYQDMLRSKVGSLKINEINLLTYAWNKKVVIASPVNLFAMLQLVIRQLQRHKIGENIKQSINEINKLSIHLNSYSSYHAKLGNTLKTAVNHYNNSFKEWKKLDKDVIKISSGKSKLNTTSEEIEKPLED
jgi:DNA recombination protein RmuC|tara:strand:- start:327 stop:1436 length:1110 start_codon:yes stop_codon:yes gene_type:complete